MINKYLAAILISQLSILSYAATPPADLMYADAPIDTLCFDIIDDNDQVDLQHCGVKSLKYIIKDKNAELINKGFIGYNWKDPNSHAPGGYSYYQFFEAGNKKYWIYSINSGGGSGEFTSIHLVQRKDENTLTIQNILTGDRCNNGIQDVSVNNGILAFSINLTPYDLLELSNKKISTVKEYDDLAACATCCIGKGFYTMNSTGGLNPKLSYLDFSTITNKENMPNQGKYQACFNQLLNSSVDNDNKISTQEKINSFAEQFNQKCLASAP